jgi:hypothetical protein
MSNKIEDKIRDLAHQKSQLPGHFNDHVNNWLSAEQEVLAGLSFREWLLYVVMRWIRNAGIWVANIAMILIFGGAVLWWVYRCTDWATSVLGVFTFGALASFFALVFKLLPEEKLEAVQKDFVAAVLSSYFTFPSLALLLVLAYLVIGFFVGSLELEAGKGGGDARVWAYGPGDDLKSVDSAPLAANGRVRFPIWTTWSGRDYRIKVTGLPEKQVTVLPWFRVRGPQQYLTPVDMLRPVVLIGAQTTIASIASEKPAQGAKPFKLHVQVERKEGGQAKTYPYEADFNGRAVWLGCKEGDVDVPKQVLAQKEWADPLGRPKIANILMPPSDLPGMPEQLEVGDILTVHLTNPADVVISKSHTLTVRRPFSVDDFVQAMVLTEP